VARDDSLTDIEKRNKIAEGTEKIVKPILEAIETGVLSDAASPVLKKATEERIATTVKEDTMAPPQLDVRAAVKRAWWDTDFIDLQEDLLDADDADKPALIQKINTEAENVVKTWDKTITSARARWSKDDTHNLVVARSDFIRAKAITGFSLEEIQNKSFANLMIDKEKSWDIPVEMFDPKYVLMVEGMESAEALAEYKKTTEGNQKLNDIYDALVEANPKAGVGRKEFYELQYTLLQSIRKPERLR